jgi:DNA-binding CsgD family transcriptional regulator
LLANLYLGNLEAASHNAARLRDLLDAHENLRGWRFRVNLLDYYGTVGDYENARITYERATATASRSPSPASEISLKCAIASVQEAAKDYRGALKTASVLFHDPSPFLINVGRIGLALICSRCTLALGDFAESKKWNERGKQMGRRGLLDQVLTLQLQVALENKIRVKAPNLTEKERICLSLSANGQTSTDIGIKLGITPRTVNFHFSKILKKLGAINRQEAIAKALRANLIKQ